MQWMVLFDT